MRKRGAEPGLRHLGAQPAAVSIVQQADPSCRQPRTAAVTARASLPKERPIDVPAASNGQDEDASLRIPYLIDESIVADAEPIDVVRTLQLFHSGRARIPTQGVDMRRKTPADSSRKLPELPRRSGRELDDVGQGCRL